MRPEFSYTANSVEEGDKSGLAVWRYTIQRRGEDVETIVRQRFDSFAEAHAINDLLIVAWEAGLRAGLRAGHERVCHIVDSAIREYR